MLKIILVPLINGSQYISFICLFIYYSLTFSYSAFLRNYRDHGNTNTAFSPFLSLLLTGKGLYGDAIVKFVGLGVLYCREDAHISGFKRF